MVQVGGDDYRELVINLSTEAPLGNGVNRRSARNASAGQACGQPEHVNAAEVAPRCRCWAMLGTTLALRHRRRSGGGDISPTLDGLPRPSDVARRTPRSPTILRLANTGTSAGSHFGSPACTCQKQRARRLYGGEVGAGDGDDPGKQLKKVRDALNNLRARHRAYFDAVDDVELNAILDRLCSITELGLKWWTD